MVSKSNSISWIRYESNPVMKYQKDTNKFHCTQHNKEFQGKAAAARHSRAIHKITLDGTQLNIVNNEPEKEIQSEVDAFSESMDNSEHSDVEHIVYENLNHEYARGGTQIAQNTDLRFIYEKTKKMFPPEWNFATWISALVTFALKEFGINASVWQNMEVLSQDKLRFVELVTQDWKNQLSNL